MGNPGGPGGIRTPDLLNAIEARSQLRHRPTHVEDSIVLYIRTTKTSFSTDQASANANLFDFEIPSQIEITNFLQTVVQQFEYLQAFHLQ